MLKTKILICTCLFLFYSSAFSGDEIHDLYNKLSDSYNILLAAGNYQKAANCAIEQLGMDPSDPEAFMRLALSIRLMEDKGKAKYFLQNELKMIAEGMPSEIRLKGMAKALLEDTLTINNSNYMRDTKEKTDSR